MNKRASATLALAVVLSVAGCSKQGAQEKTTPASARTVDWYKTHPDALKDDEKRCAGESPSLSQPACQVVYSADNAVGEQEMHDAAARNSGSAK